MLLREDDDFQLKASNWMFRNRLFYSTKGRELEWIVCFGAIEAMLFDATLESVYGRCFVS